MAGRLEVRPVPSVVSSSVVRRSRSLLPGGRSTTAVAHGPAFQPVAHPPTLTASAGRPSSRAARPLADLVLMSDARPTTRPAPPSALSSRGGDS